MSDLYCDTCGAGLEWAIDPAEGFEFANCPECNPERAPAELYQFIHENVRLIGDVGEADFNSFSAVCPACGGTVCQLDTGEINGFEAECPDCGVSLFLESTLAIADSYQRWRGENDPKGKGKERRESLDEDILTFTIVSHWSALERKGEAEFIEPLARELGIDWSASNGSYINEEVGGE